MQVISGRLAISWCEMNEHTAYAWNAQQDEVQETGIWSTESGGLRISGDESRVFYELDGIFNLGLWKHRSLQHINHQSLIVSLTPSA